ncbi:hypothetical protein K439DRAFT_1624358 [Ramaria rubella]|nr:hypothetical protein K439DRAFT_1624358 [Ramaria rubella]
MPYGIDFTGDIGVYRRSGMFWSWGKAQRGAWFAALCHDDPDRRLGLVCVRAGEYQSQWNLPMSADGNTRGATASPHDPTHLFRAARFPTHAGLAADPGIWAYIVGTAAGEAHASPHSAMGVSGPQPALTPSRPPHTPLRAGRSPVPSRPSIGTSTPWRRDRTAPPQQALPQPGALRATPCHCGCVGWPNVRIPDVPDSLLSSPAPNPRLRPTWGQTCVVELPPPRHARSLLLACCLSKRVRSASGGPPGEDVQAVRSSEPHPIAGGRPTPPFDTLNLALLHVVQHAACLGGLSPGERECVVACLRGMPAPPQSFLGVVTHLRSLADQTSLTPWDFDP